MRFGPWEIALIVVIVILLFGAKKIPEVMRGFGSGIKEFKKGLKEGEEGKMPEDSKKPDSDDSKPT